MWSLLYTTNYLSDAIAYTYSDDPSKQLYGLAEDIWG